MKIIIIRNYKKKLLGALIIVVIWTLMLALAGYLTQSRPVLSITINDYLSFSHPLSFEIEGLYVNKRIAGVTTEAYYPFMKPQRHEFNTYESLEGKFAFSYPSAFAVSPENMTGGEILYHIGFRDRENIVHGFVQVWQLSDPMYDFIQASRQNSQLDFLHFKESPVVINGLSGISWDYAFTGKTNTRAMEVFLEKEKLMYRLSYFLPEEKWSDAQAEIFRKMVASFKTF